MFSTYLPSWFLFGSNHFWDQFSKTTWNLPTNITCYLAMISRNYTSLERSTISSSSQAILPLLTRAYTTCSPFISLINYDKDNKLFLYLVLISTFFFISANTVRFPLILGVHVFFSTIMHHMSIKLSWPTQQNMTRIHRHYIIPSAIKIFMSLERGNKTSFINNYLSISIQPC